ncbi:hypothetical protein [Stakelama tenebrarum]|uniref:PRC-barrel domain-containing protein n=1 Tax=Stakelama tenebrarum TaxID=2711215 RepID=A0A6G6Y733_9SPHN|nr:hypothetical protein [Sphingosinithalassobacter tenebrarum]QIG80719.1 hypothetical protein G5C33_13625 [Sphingosinithalassobacter tenebrarum]
MKKLLPLVIASLAVATPAAAQAQDPTPTEETTTAVAATEGTMIYDASGRRLGSVYAVGEDGSAQILYRGKKVVIPAETLSEADGKLLTSMSRADVARAR